MHLIQVLAQLGVARSAYGQPAAPVVVHRLGALRDMTVTDDQQNSAWNGIWYVKTGRFENGWTMEVAINFSSSRPSESSAPEIGL